MGGAAAPPPPPTPPLDFRIFPENKAPLLASFLLRTLRHPLLKHHFFDHRGKAPFAEASLLRT